MDFQDDPGREGVAGARRIDHTDLEGGHPQVRPGQRSNAAIPTQGHENVLRPQPADGGGGAVCIALADKRAGLIGVAVEDVRPGQGLAEKGPGLAVRADDIDERQRPEAFRPAEDPGELFVEPPEQADSARIVDERPVLPEPRQDRGGGHLHVRSGVGMITPVLAAGHEDEVERGRGLAGEDRIDTDALLPEAPGQELPEEIPAGREDGAETGSGQAKPREVGRDVAGVPADRRPDGTERELARPGHALEPARDQIDDGDAADEDHLSLLVRP